MAKTRAYECADTTNSGSPNAESKPDSSPIVPESKGYDAGAGSDSVSVSGPNAGAAAEPEPILPPLTPQEFRIYNRLAEQMDYFVYIPLSSSEPPFSILPSFLSNHSPHLLFSFLKIKK